MFWRLYYGHSSITDKMLQFRKVDVMQGFYCNQRDICKNIKWEETRLFYSIDSYTKEKLYITLDIQQILNELINGEIK